MIAALSIIGGLLNRWRGGWGPNPFGSGTTIRRVLFSVATAAWATVLLGASWWAPVFALAFWVGLMPGWGRWMDLGRNNGEWDWDFAMLSLRGLFLTALPAVPLYFWPGHDLSATLLFAGCGLFMGVCYELAYRIPSRVKNFQRGPELGEVVFGTWIWLVLALVL